MTDGRIRIRRAGPDDAGDVALLLTQLGYPATVEDARRRIVDLATEPGVSILIAERDGRVAGLATLHVRRVLHDDAPRGQLTALVVAEWARQQGVGRALVQQVEKLAARAGAGQLVVTTANHRTDAHEFYSRLEYSWTGRRYAKPLSRDHREER